MANEDQAAIAKAGWLPRLFTAMLPKVRPFQEMGVAGTPVYAGYVLTPEKSSALIGQQKYRTYSEMLANVSIIAAGVRYFLNIISKPEWSFEAPEDSGDEGQQYCDFLNEVLLDGLHTPWSRVVRRCGTYRFHGFNIQEWTAKRRDDGKIGFEDIESRPQWTIWRWEVDERGIVTGMWQRDPLTGRELGLPRSKVMYLVDDTLTDSPEGLGLLRHCYEPARRLEEYQKQEGFGYLRDLQGVPLGRAPITDMTNAVANKKMTQAQMNAALKSLKDFVTLEKKDRDTGLVLDSQPFLDVSESGVTNAGQMKWGLELISGAAPGLDPINQAIVRITTEIARILGVEHLLLGADAEGSFALAKEKARDLHLLANSVLRDIREQVQHDLVWPLWQLNGFPEEMMPKAKTEDVAPKDVEQISRVMRDMATAGAPLQPDDEIQNSIRDLLGMPHVDLEKMADMMQQQQQMQQQQMEALNAGKAGAEEDDGEEDQKQPSKQQLEMQDRLDAWGAAKKRANGHAGNGYWKADWDESKHPRGDHGQWTSGGGGDGSAKHEQIARIPVADRIRLSRRVFWHGTSDEALRSIRSDGLSPGRGRGSDEWAETNVHWREIFKEAMGSLDQATIADRKASIFIADKPSVSQEFALLASELTRTEPILLRVRLPYRDVSSYFKPKAQTSSRIREDEFTTSGSGAYRFVGTVPPKWIAVCANMDCKRATPLGRLSKAEEEYKDFYIVIPLFDPEAIQKAEWDESKHHRAKDGKFSSGGGGGGGSEDESEPTSGNKKDKLPDHNVQQHAEASAKVHNVLAQNHSSFTEGIKDYIADEGLTLVAETAMGVGLYKLFGRMLPTLMSGVIGPVLFDLTITAADQMIQVVKGRTGFTDRDAIGLLGSVATNLVDKIKTTIRGTPKAGDGEAAALLSAKDKNKEVKVEKADAAEDGKKDDSNMEVVRALNLLIQAWNKIAQEQDEKKKEKREQVEKMVAYTQAAPYRWEDKTFASRAGAADGYMDEDVEDYFSPLAGVQGRSQGPYGSMRDPNGQQPPLNMGDDVVPGSRMRTKGRRRIVP